MMNTLTRIRKNGKRGGFTLVELLVAAVILVVMIISLVGIVRYARKEQTVDYHRRQARALINRTFENAFASNAMFPRDYTIYQHIIWWNEETKQDEERVVEDILGVSSTTPTIERTFNRIILDRRAGFVQVEADMTIRIDYQPFNVGQAPNNSTIETHLITITVEWPEVGQSNKESITLTKRLSAVSI